MWKFERKNSKSSISRSARSHTLDFLDVGILSVACESFIVRGNFIECTGVTNLNRQLLYRSEVPTKLLREIALLWREMQKYLFIPRRSFARIRVNNF